MSADIGRRALDAGARFGRVVGHPADCFAYTFAKTNAPLLFEGNDFAQTDVNDAAVEVEPHWRRGPPRKAFAAFPGRR